MKRFLVLLLIILVMAVACIQFIPNAPAEPEKQLSNPRTLEERSDRGTSGMFTIQEPLEGERFVKGETINLKVSLPASSGVMESQLQWHSNVDGYLGTGLQMQITKLSVGTHDIQVGDTKNKALIHIRVYDDLWELYQSPLSVGESNRIMSDFTIRWMSGNSQDEKWDFYESFGFDQHSANPSKAVSLARLDILRHQRFSQPLPFTKGKTAYDHLRDYVKTFNIRLDCGINTAGGSAVNLNRNFSVWDSRQSGSQDKPNICKSTLSSPPVMDHYIHSLYLLLHEGRHCEPNEPGHTVCNGLSNMDQTLEPGSGHARAALYLIWIYKYGLYDPSPIKQEAKLIAKSLFESRFCVKPVHSDQKVQVLLKELLP